MPSNTVRIELNSEQVVVGASGVQLTLSVRCCCSRHWPQHRPRPGSEAGPKAGRIGTAGPQHGPMSRLSGPKHCADTGVERTASTSATSGTATSRRYECDMRVSPAKTRLEGTTARASEPEAGTVWQGGWARHEAGGGERRGVRSPPGGR